MVVVPARVFISRAAETTPTSKRARRQQRKREQREDTKSNCARKWRKTGARRVATNSAWPPAPRKQPIDHVESSPFVLCLSISVRSSSTKGAHTKRLQPRRPRCGATSSGRPAPWPAALLGATFNNFLFVPRPTRANRPPNNKQRPACIRGGRP